MREPNIAGAAGSLDPGAAPELTGTFFDQADICMGGRVIRHGRPLAATAKRLVTVRIDRDFLQRLPVLGPGWRTRVNGVPRALVDQKGKVQEIRT